MWLPKDEMHLLMGYYVSIGNVDEEVWFALKEWVHFFDGPTWVPILTPCRIRRLAHKAKHYPVNVEPSNADKIQNGLDPVYTMSRFLSDKNKIEMANNRLEKRGFIKLRRNHSGTMMGITLKIEGYDLARKYSSTLGTAWVWCDEHKFWVILAVIISLIGVLVAIFKD